MRVREWVIGCVWVILSGILSSGSWAVGGLEEDEVLLGHMKVRLPKTLEERNQKLFEFAGDTKWDPQSRIDAASALPETWPGRNEILLEFLPKPDPNDPEKWKDLWAYSTTKALLALPLSHPRREESLCELLERPSFSSCGGRYFGLRFKRLAVQGLPAGPKKTAFLKGLREECGPQFLKGVENQEALDLKNVSY